MCVLVVHPYARWYVMLNAESLVTPSKYCFTQIIFMFSSENTKELVSGVAVRIRIAANASSHFTYISESTLTPSIVQHTRSITSIFEFELCMIRIFKQTE